jgi:hypothetical protein
MRSLVLAATALVALPLAAQSPARPQPPGMQVVDKVLPPPVVNEYSPPPRKAAEPQTQPRELQPEVSVRKEGDTTIEEYRLGGKLYKQRVTPVSGVAYTLIDEKGEGKFTRIDGPEPKIAIPMWVLLTW